MIALGSRVEYSGDNISNGSIDAFSLYHDFIVQRFNLPEDGIRTIDDFADAVGAYKAKKTYFRAFAVNLHYPSGVEKRTTRATAICLSA